MNILAWIKPLMMPPCPPTNCKHRRVTIGFYLFSCDIYPGIGEILRAYRKRTFDKAAEKSSYSHALLFEFPVALCYSCAYSDRDRRVPIGILSLIKPLLDSYPVDVTVHSYCT